MLRRETLTVEHAELCELADLLRDAAASRPVDLPRLSRIKWRLGRVLIAHLAKEDRLLHPLLQREGSPAAAALSRRFEAEMGGLAAAFHGYMERWTPDAVMADPATFEHATGGLVDALLDRIGREERELYVHIPAPKVDVGAPDA